MRTHTTPSASTLRTIASGFRGGLLGKRDSDSMCFITCYALSGYLHFLGYENDLIEGELHIGGTIHGHYWIKVGRLILDPTADQFKRPNGEKMPPIYVGQKPAWYLPLSK